MTDWTTRIDALLAERPKYENDWWDQNKWKSDRLSLAAERLREPHGKACRINQATWHGPENGGEMRTASCTCGKDNDMRRILEGNK